MDEQVIDDNDVWITQDSYSHDIYNSGSSVSNLFEPVAPVDRELGPVAVKDKQQCVACLSVQRVSDSDLQQQVKDRIPKATTHNTKWAVNIWDEWRKRRNLEFIGNVNEHDRFVRVPDSIIDICNEELSYWLAKFVFEVRKKESGELYQGNTLYQMIHGLQRFMRGNGRPELNVLEQPEFKLLRDSLDSEMKRLISEGVGVQVKQTEPLSKDEEDILWNKGLLGSENPRIFLNTIVFVLEKCFALKGGQEHRSLKFKQFTLVSVGESEKLCYNSFGEKNCKGGLKDRKRKPKSIDTTAMLRTRRDTL